MSVILVSVAVAIERNLRVSDKTDTGLNRCYAYPPLFNLLLNFDYLPEKLYSLASILNLLLSTGIGRQKYTN
jgi:hypothetical protein